MKHLLISLLFFALWGCSSFPEKNSNISSQFNNIRLDFSHTKKYFYSIESYISLKNQKMKVKGILTIDVKENNLADVTLNYQEITSSSNDNDTIKIEPVTTILKGMNANILFQNGLEYLEFYPKLIFPIPDKENGNIIPEVKFKVPINLRDSRKSEPNSQASIDGKLSLEIVEEDSNKSKGLLNIDGQIDAADKISNGGVEQKITVKGHSDYLFNTQEYRFEEMVIKMNMFFESPQSGSSTVNIIQIYKFLREE